MQFSGLKLLTGPDTQKKDNLLHISIQSNH